MFCFIFGHKYQFIPLTGKHWACCSRCAQLRELQTEQVTEIEVIEKMQDMCVESCSPEQFDAWESLKFHLVKTRKNLKAA